MTMREGLGEVFGSTHVSTDPEQARLHLLTYVNYLEDALKKLKKGLKPGANLHDYDAVRGKINYIKTWSRYLHDTYHQWRGRDIHSRIGKE